MPICLIIKIGQNFKQKFYANFNRLSCFLQSDIHNLNFILKVHVHLHVLAHVHVLLSVQKKLSLQQAIHLGLTNGIKAK